MTDCAILLGGGGGRGRGMTDWVSGGSTTLLIWEDDFQPCLKGRSERSEKPFLTIWYRIWYRTHTTYYSLRPTRSAV